jgi:signal transduction histidine kinase
MSAGDHQAGVATWQRRLLPGELGRPEDRRRSARDWVVDVLALAVAWLIGAALLVDAWDQHGQAQAIADIVLGVAAGVLLWWRRPHPTGVAIAIGAMSAVSAVAAGPALVALFNAAIRSSRRGLAAVLGVGVAAAVVYSILYPDTQDPLAVSIVIGVLITGVIIGWGLFIRARRELVRSLRERAARLEAEQRLRVEQAREAERRRIAREMHDVLAHRVSLLSVHAGALEFRPDAPPEEIAQAAGVIRATARAALEELRAIVGVLREGDEAGTEPPQPTLADVPALVDESRAAGMRIDLDRAGPLDTVPDVTGRAAYRIVQEGLTNARKHAPGATVRVRVAVREGDELEVVVANRAPVAVPFPAAAEPDEPLLPGAGSGLIGLRERVELAGGRLEHGPDAAGDFVLRATLPLEP